MTQAEGENEPGFPLQDIMREKRMGSDIKNVAFLQKTRQE